MRNVHDQRDLREARTNKLWVYAIRLHIKNVLQKQIQTHHFKLLLKVTCLF